MSTVEPTGQAPFGARVLRGKSVVPRLLVLPAVLIVAATTLYPAIWSLWISLHSWFPAQGTGRVWVGLENYKELLSSDRFWHAMKNLAYYVIVGVGVEMVLGIALALAVYEFVK